MQTLAGTAKMIIRWERKNLPNGGYRLDDIEQLEVPPEVAGYTDCTQLKQFQDELENVLLRFVPVKGAWVGVRKVDGDSAVIIAILVE